MGVRYAVTHENSAVPAICSGQRRSNWKDEILQGVGLKITHEENGMATFGLSDTTWVAAHKLMYQKLMSDDCDYDVLNSFERMFAIAAMLEEAGGKPKIIAY